MRLLACVLYIVLLLITSGCGGMSNPYAGEEDLYVLHSFISQDPKGFDPVRSSDVLSSSLIAQMYEGLYQYSYLKRPYALEPELADGMFDISENGLVYTFKIKKGVKFMDDPCFESYGGKGREVVAEDFIYSWKRLGDRKNDSEGYWIFQGYIRGLDEFGEKSAGGKPTDYSLDVEGLQAPDRYTIRVELTKPYPRLPWVLAMEYTSVVPREAVEYYGEEFLNHPVGTGPFCLKHWSHWHKIVLEKNLSFRDEFYPAEEGEPGDREKGLLEAAGMKLPISDRVVYTIIKQSQPAWLYFLSGYTDVSGISKDNWDTAMTSLVKLSPEMEAKNVTLWRTLDFGVLYVSYNMNDPLIGMKFPEVAKKEIAEFRNLAAVAMGKGETEKAEELNRKAGELEKELPGLPEKNEKRRKIRAAMSLAYNRPERIEIFANGRAQPAQGPIPPGFVGFDPDFRNPYSEFDIEKAKKLLAEGGYPGGKGPDGNPLLLNFEMTGSSTATQQAADFFRQEMKKIGIVIKLNQNTWTEFQEKLRTNRAQVYSLMWIADYPDPENFLQLFYGPNKSPNPNNANYENPEYDRLYDEMSALSDFDPEQAKRKYGLCREMEKIVTRDCPWIFGLTYYSYTLVHSWRKNFKPHSFGHDTVKYLGVDPKLRRRLSAEWNEAVMWPAYLVLVLVLLVVSMFIYKVKKQGE